MKELSEQNKIIRQFIRQYAGDSNLEQVRAAVSAITPIAEKRNEKAEYMLGKYCSWGYGEDCDIKRLSIV